MKKDNYCNRRLFLLRKKYYGKRPCREIGYIYIDSGAMYRAVTLYSIENGIFQGNDIDTERLRKEIDDIHISFQLTLRPGVRILI